uniref:Ribosomal protein L29 n=1 Tax=Schimmelmannia schousboei TaxID=173468 RepID=A0A1C9C919_9FLOR|nr:ribosomal protein L29 [Schimmelmannia schousboei]AOM64875.1 ribosomal protein L29 [Schimmelmannia schousboei]
MAFTKITNIKNLELNKIQEKIIELKKEIFHLKLKQKTKQNILPHMFKHKKHELAQLLTIETQQQS